MALTANLEIYKKDVLGTIQKFYSEKKNIVESDHLMVKENLKPGEVVPKKGIKTDQARKRLYELYGIYREEIIAEADNARRLLNISEAPSEEAVRVLGLVSNMDNVDQYEFNTIAEKYGKTYLASKLLKEIAAKHHLQYKASTAFNDLHFIDEIEEIALENIRPSTDDAMSIDLKRSFALDSIAERFLYYDENGKLEPEGLYGLGMTGLGSQEVKGQDLFVS